MGLCQGQLRRSLGKRQNELWFERIPVFLGGYMQNPGHLPHGIRHEGPQGIFERIVVYFKADTLGVLAGKEIDRVNIVLIKMFVIIKIQIVACIV